jgi:aminoglycoside phosphotransferase
MWKPTLGKRLGTGKEAEVFEFGDMVVKLYQADAPKRSAFREAANLALVEAFGLPVPSVSGVRQVGDRWGLVMARADGPSFADAMKLQPELLPKYLQRMALLQLRVHSHPGTWFPSLKTRLGLTPVSWRGESLGSS